MTSKERAARCVAARLVGPTDAEDIVQETFLRAYHGLEKFRGESSLKTWLYAIALNRARARHGTLARMRQLFVTSRRSAPGEEPYSAIDDAVDPAALSRTHPPPGPGDAAQALAGSGGGSCALT